MHVSDFKLTPACVYVLFKQDFIIVLTYSIISLVPLIQENTSSNYRRVLMVLAGDQA